MSTTLWEAVLALPVSPARDHIRGPVGAPLTLVEYGDYECFYCGAAHAIVGAIQAYMAAELRFVFRHFPMTTIHPHAQPAAEAAEARYAVRAPAAARRQLSCRYAQALGLDLGRFSAELTAHLHVPKIREDFLSGVRSGVNGTPTFYINGVRHDCSWDAASLLTALQQAARVSA